MDTFRKLWEKGKAKNKRKKHNREHKGRRYVEEEGKKRKTPRKGQRAEGPEEEMRKDLQQEAEADLQEGGVQGLLSYGKASLPEMVAVLQILEAQITLASNSTGDLALSSDGGCAPWPYKVCPLARPLLQMCPRTTFYH